ncbi:MAG: TIGR01777 family oxidoreductase [Phycisphaerales bacterium]|nr:TIGR01777 family oxidoreductase [Phycisphaerales bacterium]
MCAKLFRVVIAGGSGFLGRALARHLGQRGGFDVVLLSRTKPNEKGPWRFEPWDARTPGPWSDVLDGADVLVNLVGRTVDCIKTPDHQDEILRSRVDSTRVLGQVIQRLERKPSTWVQMSTAHIYGDPPSVWCDESSSFGTGLAPEVGMAWEHAFDEGCPETVRRVILRTSFVLGRSGGALPRLSLIARLGLGGRVGHGRQGMSWLHQDDMNRIFERAILDSSMEGVYIATGPNPVSNEVFMRALRKAVGMPIGLPAMAWMVRIGAPLFMRTDPELALYGRYCVPKRLLAEGFKFEHEGIENALCSLLRRVK